MLNGVSRPFFGWVSDSSAASTRCSSAFALEGVAFFLFSASSDTNPAGFVLLTGLVFFAYGEIYSLFPAICADGYGKKFASANAGLLYTAKGAASLLVPLSELIAVGAGGWHSVFVVLRCHEPRRGVSLALVVLKPLRARRTHASELARYDAREDRRRWRGSDRRLSRRVARRRRAKTSRSSRAARISTRFARAACASSAKTATRRRQRRRARVQQNERRRRRKMSCCSR